MIDEITFESMFGDFDEVYELRRNNEMSKSILVIDTPKRCSMCKFMRNTDEEYHYCRVLGFDYQVDDYMMSTLNGKSDWCPLVDLPEKMNADDYLDDDREPYTNGWNDCIDEILKKEKY